MAIAVKFGISCALICVILSRVDSAKILMFPLISLSHTLDQASLAEEFVLRGNEVYFILHEDRQISLVLEKLQGAQIVVFPREAFGPGSNADGLMERITQQAFEGKGDVAQFSKWAAKILGAMCKTVLLENEDALLQLERIEADVLIADYAVMWKCPYLISLRLGIPTIPFGLFVEPWVGRLPYLASYVPTYFLPVADRMSFTERAKNAFVAFVAGFLSPFHPDLTDAIDAYKVYGDITDIDSLLEQTPLWLYSTHLVLDYPKPTMPNVVPAGGMTTTLGKPLSGDVLDIVNKSRKGVILVSFGSLASYLTPQITQRIIAAFASIPEYTFLWRFDNRNKVEFPANVIVKDWLPQNDLLAHQGKDAHHTLRAEKSIRSRLSRQTSVRGASVLRPRIQRESPHIERLRRKC